MKKYKGLILTGILVVVIWLLSWMLIQNYYGTRDDDGRGTFGDMFGAVNSLFAGLAFAGIIYTIIMQRKDLELQAESIKLQTKAIEMQTEELGLMKQETARMADELENQRMIMNSQKVESMIFRLFQVIEKNFESIRIRKNIENFQKQEAINFIYKIINSERNNGLDRKTVFEREIKIYKSTFEKYTNSIIYTLQYIEDADIDKETKKVFAEILNASMGNLEILLLVDMYIDSQHEMNLLVNYGFIERYTALI